MSWRVAVTVPHERLAAVEAALAPFGFALSSFEAEPTPDAVRPAATWRIELLCHAPPDRAELRAALRRDAFVIGELPERDWVAETNRLLAPVRAGRFWLHGAGHPAGPPSAWSLKIEAGRAFGTGRAPSTLGCLLAIDMLAKRTRARSVLDIGTGSGVLALASARAWPAARVRASDIDPVAVSVARENARANGVRLDVRRGSVRCGHYDLVLANILAGPLIRLAGPIAGVATGHVALAGLLVREERAVLAAYAARGFRLERMLRLQDWSALVLTRP